MAKNSLQLTIMKFILKNLGYSNLHCYYSSTAYEIMIPASSEKFEKKFLNISSQKCFRFFENLYFEKLLRR